jgi:eukaryotic-like serine/threonine-protein kinase
VTLTAGTKLGRYEIRSKIGEGGMGEVYLAEDTRLDRTVALKVLPAEMAVDQERMRRFVQEAKAASALNHPNVAHIYEIGEAGGTSFIAMEHVEGQALDAKIKGRALDSIEIVDIAEQVADALDAAHTKGIIHRDIKPSNIMITPRAQAKVLDFGLAKISLPAPARVESDMSTALKTETGVVMGTMPYMSPEQVLGHDVDCRTDIFSLGVVMYEMAAARRPFCGETASETMDQIIHSQPEAIARFNYNVTAELERIIRKCIEKEPERRYQSARDLFVDLRNLKRDSDSSAVVSEKVRTHPRSKLRRALLAATVVAAVVVAGLGLYLMADRGKAIDSIAVLPFVNESADPNVEYLSDGIPESIINSLSQLPSLKVMSRASAFRFKGREAEAQEVGQKLGVRAVLTGRVAQRGESLLISIGLVDARDNSQIWGQQYNRKLADVFAVQEEIAKEISEKLRLKLSGTERQQLAKRPTESLKAFQYYMQGRAYIQRSTREDLLTGIRYYENAIEEDHNYALAYAGLADAYAILGARGHIAPQEGRSKAEEMARKALALDDNLAEAHAALGLAYIDFVPYNFSLSDRELRRAIELSPSLALAHFYLGLSLARQGRLDEVLAELLKARDLDPLSPIIARLVALPYYLKRDYARALELVRQSHKLGPALSTTLEIGIYIQDREFDEAMVELEKAKRERQSDPILIYGTGAVYAARGERAEALKIIKELEEMSGASLSQAQAIARIYAALNEKELAFAWLERGLAAGAIGIFLKDDPIWDPIRDDPRFADLLRRMGIPS